MKLFEVKVRFTIDTYVYLVSAHSVEEAKALVLTSRWQPGTTDLRQYISTIVSEYDTSKVAILDTHMGGR